MAIESKSQALAIESEVADAGHVLRLAGELDLASVPHLQRALDRIRPDAEQIVIDVERVTFIDSSGLRALLVWRRQCEEDGVEFRLTPGTPDVRRLFEVTGLLDRLPTLRRRRNA